ncbi:MAG: tol-pal system protein YbgF [Nitrospirota bacterium]
MYGFYKKIVIGIFTLFMAGCVTDESALKTQNDILALQRQSYENSQKIIGLENNMDESLSNIRKNQADISSKVDRLTEEFQRLYGRFEESRHYTEKSLRDIGSLQLKELRESLENLKQRVETIEKLPVKAPQTMGQAKVEEQPKTQEQPKPQEQAKVEEKVRIPEPPKKEEKPLPPIEMYKDAYSTMKSGDVATARTKFKKYLDVYPNNEYSDNAQFWLGESYYQEKDFESAILAYEEVIRKFPKSEKRAAAMLKQGFSFYELGDKTSGRLLLEAVLKNYPTSQEAALAKKRLKAEGIKLPTRETEQKTPAVKKKPSKTE